MESREYLVELNVKLDYKTNEYEDVEDEKTSCKLNNKAKGF
jgi:hypothetical protein